VSDPQRTHPATPKRVREFRQRGEIALSRDLVAVATLAGGAIALAASSDTAHTALLELMRQAALGTDGRDAAWLPSAAAGAFATAAGPAGAGATLATLAATLAQLGWPPALKWPALDLARLSPLANLQSAFGLAGMGRRTGAALAKLALVAAIVAAVLRGQVATAALEATGIGALAASAVARVVWAVLAALAALAALDYFLARRRIGEQMRMTADEVKREVRESEGDPHLRGKRRQRMRELGRRRLAAAVAKADAVVVNPTHYAVALRYDDAADRAPVVVAKGIDEQAARIRELARAHGVPVLSRPPLARALHKHVKEGRPVPANLYRAVAEVLAYVYRLRRGGAA
jgi:flagellar biosynthetic protein FlhB